MKSETQIVRLGSMMFENAATGNYKKILELCKLLRELTKMGGSNKNALNQSLDDSQQDLEDDKANLHKMFDEKLLRTIGGRNLDEKVRFFLKIKIFAKNETQFFSLTQIHNTYLQLQQRVNALYDADLDKLNKTPIPGIRQVVLK